MLTEHAGTSTVMVFVTWHVVEYLPVKSTVTSLVNAVPVVHEKMPVELLTNVVVSVSKMPLSALTIIELTIYGEPFSQYSQPKDTFPSLML
jgi:hypothetical protein